MNFLFGGLTFIWGSILFNFIGAGGIAHCTVECKISLFFARLNFIGGGGLKHPQALMTRPPPYKYTYSTYDYTQVCVFTFDTSVYYSSNEDEYFLVYTRTRILY